MARKVGHLLGPHQPRARRSSSLKCLTQLQRESERTRLREDEENKVKEELSSRLETFSIDKTTKN